MDTFNKIAEGLEQIEMSDDRNDNYLLFDARWLSLLDRIGTMALTSSSIDVLIPVSSSIKVSKASTRHCSVKAKNILRCSIFSSMSHPLNSRSGMLYNLDYCPHFEFTSTIKQTYRRQDDNIGILHRE